MLWILTIASIMGFLASQSLAESAQLQQLLLPTNADNWQQFSLIFVVILVSLLGFYRFLLRHFVIYQFIVVKFLWGISVFILTLVASSSYGVYQYFVYQQTLLTQPLTITATIRPLQISDTISDTLTIQQKSIEIGNSYSRHAWQLLAIDDDFEKAVRLPMNVLVIANTANNADWQPILNTLQPNQSLTVKLALQPIPQQLANLPANAKTVDLGFDESLWLRQRNIQAKAQLLAIETNSQTLIDKNSLSKLNHFLMTIETLRWQLRKNLQHDLYQNLTDITKNSQQNMTINNYAILLGLLTGDKALMNSDIKNLYQLTGISHLLAISGPHVLMLASVVAFWVVFFVKCWLPSLFRRLPSRLLWLWVSVVVAGFYALLVGFEIPAQRTFLMLVLMTISTQLLVNIPIYRLLAMVGLLMIWWDTTAVLQAGFWLSFVAVGLLVKFSEYQQNYQGVTLVDKLLYESWQLLKLQLWLFVLMMPVVIWFFGKVSLLSVLVNLFAVPLLGLVIVPLDILAGVLSLLPVIGGSLAGLIWSLLAMILGVFHAVLVWLVDGGFAKQLFVSLLVGQLLVCVLAGVVLASRGVLSKWLLVPLACMSWAIGMGQQQQSEEKPKLVVLQQSRVSINLLVAGKHAWLILADNDLLEKTKKVNQKFKQKSPPKNNLSSIDTTILVNDIQPLLAKYQVNRLTGVIVQTSSPLLNDIVQQLAKTMPIQQYWLAGANPLKPLTNIDNQPLKYDKISPKNCQVGQQWQTELPHSLTVKAVTGWQLDLSHLQLSDNQRIQTATCFVQISKQSSTKNYQALITAGRYALPMQMSEKMCLVETVDLLVMPYQLPIEPTWLQQLKPNIIHVLTGRYDSQHLTESSEFALLNLQIANKNQSVSLLRADKVGDIVYQFD